MKLGPIVLRIRAADTRFGQLIGGAGELDIAMRHPLKKDMAFVIQLSDTAEENGLSNGIQQQLTERFGVIVLLSMDDSSTKDLGMAAYDQVHDVRNELFRALLGWLMDDLETPITYVGGRLLGADDARLWYQFEFEAASMLVSDPALQQDEFGGAGIQAKTWDDPMEVSKLPSFNRLYAQYILSPSKDLPHLGELPFVGTVDMEQLIDFEEEKRRLEDGGYAVGFAASFNIFRSIE
jgi:hypothetical protein